MSRLDTMARFEEPEIPNPTPVKYCVECGCEIYPGDNYYKTEDGDRCPECAKNYPEEGYIRLIAEENEEEYED
jgi:hypothetical protein